MSRRHKGTKTFCILCTLYFIHMHISIHMHGWLCLISIFPTVGTLNNLVLKCLQKIDSILTAQKKTRREIGRENRIQCAVVMWHPYKRNERNEYKKLHCEPHVSAPAHFSMLFLGWLACLTLLLNTGFALWQQPPQFWHFTLTHPPVHTHTLIRVLLICRYAAYLAPLST